MINVFQPTLGDEETEAVAEVFASGWLGKGPRTKDFEAAFADHLGVAPEHVRSVNCCTEGMFVAVELLGLGPGDEVIVPTIGFTGAANAVAARGAKPVFCDVDTRTLNPRVEQVEAKVTDRTRALLPLHYGGHPGWIADLAELCSDRGIALIEDSACSVASRADDRACGTFGDFSSWSFDAMKILVTGDGGMVYVKDPEMADRFEKHTYLGLESASGYTQALKGGRWWEYEVSSFSSRKIVNDVMSAIGLVQLGRLPSFIERRREIHERYDAELSELGWLERPPALPDGHESSFYFYWVQCEPEARDELAVYLKENDVYSTFRYYPLHMVEFYDSKEPLPEAEDAAARTLNIPIHQGLSDDDVAKVIEAVTEFGRDRGL